MSTATRARQLPSIRQPYPRDRLGQRVRAQVEFRYEHPDRPGDPWDEGFHWGRVHSGKVLWMPQGPANEAIAAGLVSVAGRSHAAYTDVAAEDGWGTLQLGTPEAARLERERGIDTARLRQVAAAWDVSVAEAYRRLLASNAKAPPVSHSTGGRRKRGTFKRPWRGQNRDAPGPTYAPTGHEVLKKDEAAIKRVAQDYAARHFGRELAEFESIPVGRHTAEARSLAADAGILVRYLVNDRAAVKAAVARVTGLTPNQVSRLAAKG